MELLSKDECRKLEFEYVPNGDVYPLWGFQHDMGVTFTRGRTSDEAYQLVRQMGNGWTPMEALPISAGAFYSSTLAAQDCPFARDFQWLVHPPVWVLRQNKDLHTS